MMILGIVLLVIIILAAWFYLQTESPTAAAITKQSNRLTGALTEQTAQQEQTQQQNTQQQATQEQTQQTPEEAKPQDKKYFEDQRQCAFDIKQRQDDIAETTNVVNTHQQEIDKLTAEYERQKKDLEEKYTYPLTTLKAKIEESNKEMKAAQQRYETAKQSCVAQVNP